MGLLRTIIQISFQDISGKIILMKNLKVKKVCNNIIDQHINRMHQLCDEKRIQDAESVYSEIRDWVIQKENLEVLSLEYISGYFMDF